MGGFDFTVRTKRDMIDAVQHFGIVPLFANSIVGFSVEEHSDPSAWYKADGEWKIWEWKGPVIRETGCAYGKFFDKKACFISRELFPDFANYRRDGYDFDARYDDGLSFYGDKVMYELISENAPILSKRLKTLGNYRKDGVKGFDTVINRLQAQGYVIISDFVYQRDRYGVRYGWGVAEYSTPECFMGDDFTGRVYARSPQESYEILLSHLRRLFPDADERALKKILK